jgi:hypothetical protein
MSGPVMIRHFEREFGRGLCGQVIAPLDGHLGRAVITNVDCDDCIRLSELCPTCGQADNCGDCDHTPIDDEIGGGPLGMDQRQWEEHYRAHSPSVTGIREDF